MIFGQQIDRLIKKLKGKLQYSHHPYYSRAVADAVPGSGGGIERKVGYAMSTIIKWCNDNSGFLMCILTAIYVIATLRILRSNKKAASLSESQVLQMQEAQEQAYDIQRQNFDIQLFNQRFDLYNIIKTIVFNESNNILNSFDYFEKLLGKKSFRGDENNVMKVKFLFSVECWEGTKDLFEEIKGCSEETYNLNKSIDLAQGYDMTLYNSILTFINNKLKEQLTEKDINDFKALCRNNLLCVETMPGEFDNMNFYEMHKRIEKSKEKIEKDKKILFEMFENMLYISVV